MKKTLYSLCCASVAMIMAVPALTSCDSNASDLKVERATGMYSGTVIVGLYVPDMQIENENMKITDEETIGLAADTVDTTIKLDFSNDGHVKIEVDKLNDIDLRIPFFDENGNVRELFEKGYLAQAYYKVKEMAEKGVLTEDEFDGFCEIIDTLSDKMSLSSIKTNDIVAVERGAMITTYDYEQDSYYAQFTMLPVSYSRSSNISAALEYLRNLMVQKGITSTELQTMYSTINNAVPTNGTIEDGWGWSTMAYSNYSTYIDMHIERATGVLDNLTLALFGQPDPTEGYLEWMPRKREIWFVVEYEGRIENTGIYKQISTDE